MKSEEYFKKAIEILRERGITPIRHFSPYAEGGLEPGSALQIFWDGKGNEYRFLFDVNGECSYNNLGDFSFE